MPDLLHRGQPPAAVAATLRLSAQAVFNLKRRCLQEGFAVARQDKPRSGKPPRISGAARAGMTAPACSTAPEGHARRTLRLPADRAVSPGLVEAIGHNAVRRILKKTG